MSRVSDLIGRTPLFELCVTNSGTRLLLKLEQFNPTGSAKVRMAEQMVAEAEQTGRLRPGGQIIEPTSGNTGLGLALAAIERGYRFTAIVDHHAAKDKLRAMAALGAQLVYVGAPDADGPQTLERMRIADEMVAAEDNAWRADQHNNPANPHAYRGLAHELLGDLFGDIDFLISSVGTGGSLCGTAEELRNLGSHVVTVGVEPAGSIIFDDCPGGTYWQTGGGSPEGFPVGQNVDYAAVDEAAQVTDVDAFATVRVVARRTGLMIGGTAGGAIHVALARLSSLPPESTVVTIVGDAGEKYLDTIFDDEWLKERGLLDPTAEHRVHQWLEAYTAPTPASNDDVA